MAHDAPLYKLRRPRWRFKVLRVMYTRLRRVRSKIFGCRQGGSTPFAAGAQISTLTFTAEPL